MVLGELGKVINKEPKAVIDALRDAGVKVRGGASRRELVRLIIANKRNKRLVQNLSVLITASATATDSFSNLMDDDKLAPLPATAGGKLTSTTAPTELAKGKSDGTFLQKIGAFFQKRKSERELDPTKKRTPQEESFFKRFGNWFNKNRDTIGQVGNTLYTSLGTANQNQITTDGGGNNDGGGADQTWIQRNKVVVVVGLIAIAGGIYFLTKGSGKGKGKGK